MSQETKNTEKTNATSAELSEKEQEQVAGGTPSTTKPSVSDIQITKTYDKASPKLL